MILPPFCFIAFAGLPAGPPRSHSTLEWWGAHRANASNSRFGILGKNLLLSFGAVMVYLRLWESTPFGFLKVWFSFGGVCSLLFANLLLSGPAYGPLFHGGQRWAALPPFLIFYPTLYPLRLYNLLQNGALLRISYPSRVPGRLIRIDMFILYAFFWIGQKKPEFGHQ